MFENAEMLMGFEEIDGDDDFQEEFACPFCAESYDIIGLCCHIDDEHTLESKNAVLLSIGFNYQINLEFNSFSKCVHWILR